MNHVTPLHIMKGHNMPASTVQDTATDLEQEEVEEVEEDQNEAVAPSKRVRHKLAATNVYVFAVPQESQENATALAALRDQARDQLENLEYTDGTKPAASLFKVFDILKNISEGKSKIVGFILAPNKGQAADSYLTSKDYTVELAYRKRKRGRVKTRVLQNLLDFGQLLAPMIFASGEPNGTVLPKADVDHVKTWTNYFGPSGSCAHYLDKENHWKPVNE